MGSGAPVGIIGAGMAGIAAAYQLTQAGRPVRIFEAREVTGGRARTTVDDDTPGPIELGAEFIHGTAEPTLDFMSRTGVRAESVLDRHVRYVRGSFKEMGRTWSHFARLFEGAHEGRDRSAEEFREQKHFDGADAELYRLLIEGFEAAPLEEVSVQSLADEAAGAADDPAQFRPAGGYGSLVASIESLLDPALARLSLNATVTEVHWSSDGRCALRVRRGDEVETVDTEGCIVTVPLGVLFSSGMPSTISFFPEIRSHERLLSLLGMGRVVKVVLRFRPEPWTEILPDSDFIHFANGAFPTFWQERSAAFHQITAWAGGPKAKRLEAFGMRDLIDHVAEELAVLCNVTPTVIRDAIVSAHHHNFDRDPYSLGAYPYVKPGGGDAARELAEPVEDTIFFAGDAADTEYFGTVAGALASGTRAARQILAR